MKYYDNQSCIKLSKKPVFHDWSKHIDIPYHHFRDYVLRIIMLLEYTPMDSKMLTFGERHCQDVNSSFIETRLG